MKYTIILSMLSAISVSTAHPSQEPYSSLHIRQLHTDDSPHSRRGLTAMPSFKDWVKPQAPAAGSSQSLQSPPSFKDWLKPGSNADSITLRPARPAGMSLSAGGGGHSDVRLGKTGRPVITSGQSVERKRPVVQSGGMGKQARRQKRALYAEWD